MLTINSILALPKGTRIYSRIEHTYPDGSAVLNFYFARENEIVPITRILAQQFGYKYQVSARRGLRVYAYNTCQGAEVVERLNDLKTSTVKSRDVWFEHCRIL